MERPVSSPVLERDPASAVELRVLGPFEATTNGDSLDLGGPKQRAVLALLALRAPHGLTIERLIDGLWGEAAPEAAKSSVYAYISNLRSVLGGAIERQRGSYVLASPLTCDSAVFEQVVDHARSMLSIDPVDASVALGEALAAWRGLPYADLMDVPGLQDEIRRLEELRLLAVEMRLDADLASGKGDELVPELRALVAEHPLRERFCAQLMLALYRSGRQAEALREYQQIREALATELGVDPSPDLQDLELKILQQDAGLSVGAGQVTTQRLAFLFTDIEGSTRLWDQHRNRMAEALAGHDEIVREAVEGAGGSVFKHSGDGALSVFPTAEAAATAAEAAQRALTSRNWGEFGDVRVRMAIDVGDVDVRDGDYFGPPMNRCARILGSAHGGQVLLSAPAFDDLSSGHLPGVQIKQLGTHRLRGLGAPERVAQLVFVGLPAEFPDLVAGTASGLDERLEVGGLPGYELRERLGVGLWGAVYRAYQPSVGREVAIRVVSPHLSNHPSFVRRFEAHARAAARLEQPHIVPLHDFWRDHEGAYLVMQLMRGGSLARSVGQPWDPAAVLDLIHQVGSALAFAHAEGAVHGDLRPENVLFDGSGNAFVADFGLGAGMAEAVGLRLGQIASPGYRSPESRSGATLDQRSDVYSLGALTWALLAGREAPASGPLPPLAEGLESVDAVLLRATAHDPSERFEEVAGFVTALSRALGLGEAPPVAPVRTGLRNPFKGLRAFSEGDAGDFHGRSELVETLVDAVGVRRLVAVVGPSGSGKSSAVHAGLVPRLRAGALPGSDQWFLASLTPGPHPVGAVADALRPLAMKPLGDVEGRLLAQKSSLAAVAADLLPPDDAELVLVVDQFEELFTLTVDKQERDRFVDLLAGTAIEETRVRVVLTLRADFYDRPLEHPGLAGLVSDGLVTVVPPTVDELVEAIERPALAVGLSLEPGLAMRIAGDVVGQPGGLPLLQYALTEMVERRGADLLTGVDYEAIGTVEGAVARRAEAVYSSLDDGEQGAARDVLLRLVTVDEDTDATRRRVRLSELEGLGHHPRAVSRVLGAFGRSRLLTFDRDPVSRIPTVEVAHEALVREWGRLRQWIETEREDLVLARRIRLAMFEWQGAGRSDDYLLTGDRLAPFREWARSATLTTDERAFLELSSAADERARHARRRRRRLVLASLAIAAVAAAILAGFAFVEGRRADREADRALTLAAQEAEARNEAEAQEELAQQAANDARQAEALARARELAASAIGVGESDPQLAMLLALEALDTQPEGVETPVELRNALRRALHDNRLARVIPVMPQAAGGEGGFSSLVLAPDGSAVGVMSEADDRYARQVYLPGTWERAWESDDPQVDILALARGGERMLLQRSETEGSSPATVEIVSLLDGAVQSSFSIPCSVGATSLASWSFDGSLIALVEPDPIAEQGQTPDCNGASAQIVRVYDAVTGNVVHEIPSVGLALRLEFIESPNADLLVYTDNYANPKTVVLGTTQFDQVASFDYSLGALSPDGSRLLGIDYWSGVSAVVDVETGAVQDLLDGLEANPSLQQSGYFSPDGRRLAIANESSRIPVWEVAGGARVAALHAGQWADVGFVDADTVVTASGDGLLRVWDLSLERTGELNSADTGAGFQMHGIQASSSLGTAWTFESQLRVPAFVFDPTTGTLGDELPDSAGFWPAVAGDAGVLYLAISEAESGPLRWWSADTSEVTDIEGCWSDQPAPCPDGTMPSFPDSHQGMWSSVDGTEAGFLTSDGIFRVWRDGPEPAETVDLDLEDVQPMTLLMGFSDEWIVVRTGYASYDVFDRRTGVRDATLELPGHLWIRFDRSGSVGVGSGFDKTLSVISTDDWTSKLLTVDLGDGVGRGVALSPTGDRVAVGVMDGYVRVFEVETGKLLDVIPLETAVALHWLDDTHIAAGTRDGLWTVLTLDTDELGRMAREQLSREFTPNECVLYRIDSCAAAS